jgi:hypothetical protein
MKKKIKIATAYGSTMVKKELTWLKAGTGILRSHPDESPAQLQKLCEIVSTNT